MTWLLALLLHACAAPVCRAPALCPEYVILSREGEPLTLDVSRFVGADYLIAGTGPGFASRWGHAMLRLNFCAANATPGACVADELFALDVGFVAQVDTDVLSVIGHVMGDYPSRLNAAADLTLRTSYNEDELRDLRAYPLKLTAEQRHRLLAELAHQFWTGDRQYHFVANNCATSMLRLLLSILPPGHPLDQTFGTLLTPRGLLTSLRAFGLADRVSHVWHSRRPGLEARMLEMRRDGFKIPGRAERYARLRPSLRRAWIEQVNTLADLMVLTRLEAFTWRLARTELTLALVARAVHEPARCPAENRDMHHAFAALSVDALKRAPGVPVAAELLPEADVHARLVNLSKSIGGLSTCFGDDAELNQKRAAEVGARENLTRARARAAAL